MTDRPRFSTLAAGGIWLGTLVGSWAIGLAVLGSLHNDLFACDDGADVVASMEPVGLSGWAVLGVASVVPVLVMVSIAPSNRRLPLVGLSVAIAGLGVVVGNAWFGACL